MSCVMQGARNPISSTPGDNLHVFQLGQVCCTWEISLWPNIHLIQPESFQHFFSLSPLSVSRLLFSAVERLWTATHRNTPKSHAPQACVNSCTPALMLQGESCGNQTACNSRQSPRNERKQWCDTLVRETSSRIASLGSIILLSFSSQHGPCQKVERVHKVRSFSSILCDSD